MTTEQVLEAVGTNFDELFTEDNLLDKDKMKNIMAGRHFNSEKEALIYLNRRLKQKIVLSIPELHGLTPAQMDRLLNDPLETDDLIATLSGLDGQPDAPILTIFTLMAEAIGDKGLNVTRTGLLPLKFRRDVAAHLHEQRTYRNRDMTEVDPEQYNSAIHTTSVVAELAGLIETKDGKLVVTPECQTIMATHGPSGVYAHMFQVFVEDFDWCCSDGWQELPLLQHTFRLTLYLLRKYGTEWQSSMFYQDCFLKTYPQLLQEITPLGNIYSSEEIFRSCYSTRCLDRFACFMGLVEIYRDLRSPWQHVVFSVKKLPLLDHVVPFNREG
jgi:hypothetical protein